jgi:hypothetical protein
VVERDEVERAIDGRLDWVFAGEVTASDIAPATKRPVEAILKHGARAPVGAAS